MALESKPFESLYIDAKKGEFLLNGESVKEISHLELEFNNGEWSLLVTRDEWYKQVKPEEEVVKVDKKNTREEVLRILIDFLRRATGDGASSDEIAVIPQVAKLVLDYSSSETPVS